VKRLIAALVAACLATLGVIGLATSSSARPDNTTKAWVCKYVGTPGEDERLKNGNDGLVWVSTQAAQGTYFNDAHGRSYVLSIGTRDQRPDASLCPAPNNDPVIEGWYTWKTPNYAPHASSLSDVGLPQNFVGVGKINPTECSTTYQWDYYKGKKSAIDAVLADGKLGGTNDHPEDSGIVVKWEFKSTERCKPDQPKDTVVTVDSGQPVCGDTTIATTTTTTPYVFDEKTWKWVDDAPVVTHGVRDMTDTEKALWANQSTDPSAPCFVPPPPQKCTPSGDWKTEDIAPTVTQKGWLFSGPNVKAVDYYHPVSGNLQGLSDQSITYVNVLGFHPSLVFEINRFGTSGYATVVAEPYLNDWAAGQSGTFTVTQSTKVWTSKIASGPGSQSEPIALSDMAALFPLNTLISEGIHLGTNSSVYQYATVTQLDGCASVYTVPKQPEPEKVHDTRHNTVCSESNDGTSVTTYEVREGEQPYVWSDNDHAYVLGDPTWRDWTVDHTTSQPDVNCTPPAQESKAVRVPGEWTDDEYMCGDTTVTQTQITTVTTTNYVPEFENGKWVQEPQAPVVTTVTNTRTRPATNEDIDAVKCPLIPGDVQAKCVGNVPFLAWDLTLPAGFTTGEKNPVKIQVFTDDFGYDLPGTYPLSGKTLWPGASDTPGHLAYPGYITSADGKTYTPTDDPEHFKWTTTGPVRVVFTVNPAVTVSVTYPPATSECAKPPATSTPVTTPSPSVTPTPTHTLTPHAATPQVHLAETGANTRGLVVIAVIVIVVGALLIGLRNRKF
jgi:hypothetical protein